MTINQADRAITTKQREALNKLPSRYHGSDWYDLGLWRLGLITIIWGHGEDSDCIIGYDRTPDAEGKLNDEPRD